MDSEDKYGYDIEMYTPRISTMTKIRGLTEKGRWWIVKNMTGAHTNGRINISADGRKEVATLMRGSGLLVKDLAGE